MATTSRPPLGRGAGHRPRRRSDPGAARPIAPFEPRTLGSLESCARQNRPLLPFFPPAATGRSVAGPYGLGPLRRGGSSTMRPKPGPPVLLNVIGGYVASFGSYSTGCAQSIIPHGLRRRTLTWDPHLRGDRTVTPPSPSIRKRWSCSGASTPRNSQVSMGGIHRTPDRGLVRPLRRKGHALHQHRPAAGGDAPAGCEWLPLSARIGYPR